MIDVTKLFLNKGSEQMEVYIIEAYYCNGESEVKGVFSTFEKAKAHYDEHLKMDKNYSYTIDKWTIDTGEPSGIWWGDEML